MQLVELLHLWGRQHFVLHQKWAQIEAWLGIDEVQLWSTAPSLWGGQHLVLQKKKRFTQTAVRGRHRGCTANRPRHFLLSRRACTASATLAPYHCKEAAVPCLQRGQEERGQRLELLQPRHVVPVVANQEVAGPGVCVWGGFKGHTFVRIVLGERAYFKCGTSSRRLRTRKLQGL